MSTKMVKKTLLVIFVGVACTGSSLWAQPQFVDATGSSGLSFTLSYGTLFDEVENHSEPDPDRRELIKILWRNMGNGAAVGDYDNDGDLDIYLLGQLGNSNKLFRNNHDQGLKTFTDVTAAPLNDTGMSRTANFADLNNDGWLDLVLFNDDQSNGDGTSDYPTSKIFRNNGDGTFTDMTSGSGFSPEGYIRSGGALADYNGDGLVDIYTTVWAGGGALNVFPRTFPGENQLFRNDGDFTFTDVTATLGLDGLDRDSFTPIFTDFTGDFAPDIHVAVDHTSDEFYTNDLAGSGTFIDEVESTLGLDHVGNDMGVAVGDLDDDDDLDLYMTNIKDGDWGSEPKINALHINQSDLGGGLSFVNEATSRGVDGTLWGWGTVFVDVELDGDLDLLAVNGFDAYAGDVETENGTLPCTVCDSAAFLFVNGGAGSFTRETGSGLDTTFNQGWDSRALVSFDYDRDGDQDFLVTNIDASVELIENTTSTSNHHLTVKAEPFHLAAGARIYASVPTAFGEPVEKRRDILATRSYLSGFPAEAHFGLGGATTADLRVVWSDGCTTLRSGVAADQVLTVNPLVLDFLSAGALNHEEGATVLLAASGSNCQAEDLDADIQWAEGTVDNVVGTGASFDSSGRSAGSHPFFVLLEQDGASTVLPFTLEISAAAPPVRTELGPSGEILSGSEEAVLVVTTDENATCRYATTPGVAYEAMTDTFDTTGGVAHSTVVSGLVEGTSYGYYVRCIDGLGNANLDDAEIAFTVPFSLFFDFFESGDTSKWSATVP